MARRCFIPISARFALLPSMTPLTIAHRGARSLAPENTVVAARKAHALGADLWELDVAFTADGELIVFHDDSLERTTGAKGLFWETTLEEFSRLEPGRRFLETDPFGQLAAGAIDEADRDAIESARVPTLLEALSLTRELDWRVNVELKRLPAARPDFPLLDRVLAVVEASGAGPEHVLFSSGEHFWLDELAKRRPEFELQALIGLLPHEPIDYLEYRFKTYNVRRTRVLPDAVRELVSRGCAVNVYVVNDEDEMRRFADAGAAGLITDFPQRQLNMIREGRL
ncbi:MAG: glycerophosphodiester phosphodiesterase [Elusimicrobia bacterium CG_4_9_14_3_um_filter_62_55]|nr:MAG: glycerophosphodiester phosphodiesterase [Elusimicrobia bacterium CG22_combo_CG10-13_8_21_14_all_63_91]PJA15355.1 MAG: glycerophosphodiester phosphodiesterase [Elusimicrobia bacterium CG_4_10_14_0_2_um_filter_63_34]PJB26960.1 MAG: glycerophosphodiester phosphodiesterase [Elusimicrobia bacterium CG_4_9_14_3_um_filter_62_55]